MYNRNELYSSFEYWMEKMQNEIYFALKEYMESNKMNQSQLAKRLGFTKGYVSQVLNGNFNHSLKKLIKLSLAVKKVPDFKFRSIEDYIDELDKVYETNNVIKLEAYPGDYRTYKKDVPDDFYYDISKIA